MPEEWTGEVIGVMHNNKVSYKQLAEKLDWHEKYLCAVLNSKRNPAGAEAKVKEALSEILKGEENGKRV